MLSSKNSGRSFKNVIPPYELTPLTFNFKVIVLLQNKTLKNRVYLEVEAVEELTDEYE